MDVELDPTGFDTDYLKDQVDITAKDIEAQDAEERLRAEAEAEQQKLKELARQQELEKATKQEPTNFSGRGEGRAAFRDSNAEEAPETELETSHRDKEANEYGFGENVVEFRNAIAKGAQEAADGALTAPERLFDAANGEDIGDPNYQTEWDPMKNAESPLLKTWWGPIVEGIAHYGTYGAVTAGTLAAAAPGAIASMGAVGTGMVSAGIAALLSKNHDDHNLSGEIVQRVPEMGIVLGPLATKDSDHPLFKKLKNVLEEMSLAGAFDRILVKWFGNEGLEQAVKRNENVAIQVAEKGKDELVQSIEAERAFAERIIPVDVKEIKELPPSSFRGHKNKPVADPWQGSPNSTGKAYDIHTQVNRIHDEIGAATGSTDSVMTPLQAERMATQSGLEKSFLKEKVIELIGDSRYQSALKEAKAKNLTMEQYFQGAFERMQEIMGRDATAKTTDEFWKPILDAIPMQTGGKSAKDNIQSWAMEEVVAADLVNASLFKQLRDLSIGARELAGAGVDVMDVDGPMKTIKDRLIVGLTNVKRSRYLWSTMGRQLQAKDLGNLSEAVAKRTVELHEESKATVDMLMELIGKDSSDELLNGFLEAFSQADKIENWLDLDAFMRKKLHSFGSKNVLLKELNGVIINSVLSSVKTVERALIGTGHVVVAQPLQRALGAMSLDNATRKANLSALYAQLEAIPEAFQVFKSRFGSYWSGDTADLRTRFSEYNKYDEGWEALRRWTDQRGTIGDKVAFNLADINRRLNDNSVLTGSVRSMAAMDDTYKFIMARSRAKEKAMRFALDLQEEGVAEFTPQTLKIFQDDFYKKLLDADGNIDISKDAFLEGAFKEATLTTDLSGFSESLNSLFNQYPLIKPYFLFARTGINGLNLTYKNTPGLGLLHKRYLDVLSSSADNLDKVRQYGINSAEDLANERAILIGRQAMGAAVTLSGTGLYIGGNLTGNGPQDRQLRQSWIDSGWQPRSIKIGGAWFSYDLLEPYSIILSTIADIGDNQKLMGSEWSENYYGKMALALAGSVSSKSYLQGLTDLVDLMSLQPGKLSKITGNILNNVVPLSSARNDFGKIITPYMRELNSEMWDAIRNRNLASEKLTDTPLPIKYDLLTGNPLRDWNPIHRFVNAVTPLAITGDYDSPGRRLLRESNYDTRLSTYTAPGSIDLSKEPSLRSAFQKAIGESEITIGFKTFKNPEQALDYLADRPDVKQSLKDMRNDLNSGNRHYNPMTTYVHNSLIHNVMTQAKQKGWAKLLREDPDIQDAVKEQGLEMKEMRERKLGQMNKIKPILIKNK